MLHQLLVFKVYVDTVQTQNNTTGVIVIPLTAGRRHVDSPKNI